MLVKREVNIDMGYAMYVSTIHLTLNTRSLSPIHFISYIVPFPCIIIIIIIIVQLYLSPLNAMHFDHQQFINIHYTLDMSIPLNISCMNNMNIYK